MNIKSVFSGKNKEPAENQFGDQGAGRTESGQESGRASFERSFPSLSRGLTKEEVDARIAAGAVNRQVTVRDRTFGDIVRENVFTYFNLIFFVIAVLLVLVGSFRDLAFLPIIIGNTCIGIFQEWRSKKTLDKLILLNVPKVKLVRDGKEMELPADELVLDELVIFEAGNQIPADAIVEAGEVQVNESLLTGEADEISKKPGDELLSGSFIVSGQCRARLDKVGEDAYISKLALEAKAQKKGEDSEMIRSLNRLVKIIGILIIPISIALFSQQYFYNGQTLRDSVTSTVAAAIGMIPEGLYLLASVALAVSVMRLAMGKVLVHNMKSIETLARVDVLCVDKTGTITENTMTVKQAIPIHAVSEEKTHEACMNAGRDKEQNTAAEQEIEGQIITDSVNEESAVADASADMQEDMQMDSADAEEMSIHPYEASLQDKEEIPEPDYTAEELSTLELLLGDFAAAMSNDNITIKAMKAYFKKQTGRRPVQVFPFSAVHKYSAAVFGEKNYVLGAPEFLLKQDLPAYRGKMEQYTGLGYRVLIFGEYQGILTGGELTGKVIPLGMVLLMNPVREKAPETFRYFEEQGVKIKVISGDNPQTVSEVAKEAQIADAQNYVDASVLITREQLEEAAEKYTVFGRVTPEQKRILVGALKAKGHTVAMTGDGVNDVMALKDADCSIAMASGSDAAAHAAQIVLLESDFSKMPSVVMEGRRVVNNIERTASLFLVKNIFSLLMSLFSIMFMINYPLEPSQVSLIGMFTIGIPAFVMSLESNKSRIQGHFLSNVLFRALPAGLTDFAVISSLVIFCNEFQVQEKDVSTACTIVMAIVGIMILYRIASPMTKIHWVLWFAMIGGIWFGITSLKQIFAITMLSRKSAMLMIIFAIVAEPLLRYLSLIVQKLWEIPGWLKRKMRKGELP
mgnify:CR=1 FL=1